MEKNLIIYGNVLFGCLNFTYYLYEYEYLLSEPSNLCCTINNWTIKDMP